MKSGKSKGNPRRRKVTPRVGVWIEMFTTLIQSLTTNVTPRVGVWIEIVKQIEKSVKALESLPVWECGLKFDCSPPPREIE